MTRFAENTVFHLQKIESNYRPVFVHFEKAKERSIGNKPFRFLAAWLTDKDFEDLVNSS